MAEEHKEDVTPAPLVEGEGEASEEVKDTKKPPRNRPNVEDLYDLSKPIPKVSDGYNEYSHVNLSFCRFDYNKCSQKVISHSVFNLLSLTGKQALKRRSRQGIGSPRA